MAKSIKKNFLYSSLLTTANYIFPFITYPYVSRVLGVTNIGTCNFVDSIINYYVLFAMMGVGVVGIREIAGNRNDKEKLNKAFNSLFVLNFISTTIMLAILIVSIYTVPKLYEHRELMWSGALKLAFNYLLVNWLFQGLEDFRYIIIRTIAIKCVYVVGVFLFVHTREDYPVYYFLMAMMTVINAGINIAYSRRFVKYSLRGITLTKYLKPFLTYGFYTLLTSMYTSFNVAYLGCVSGETEVGYYTTATKISGILLSLYSAFTGVMLPRMSSLLSEGNIEKFKSLLERSFCILIAFAMPIAIFSIVTAPEIISIISGQGYEGAIVPMRIVMPLILVIGYEQILVIQTLMPLKRDKAILRNSTVGAIVGIVLNFVLVPYLDSIGSAIVWVFSELTIFAMSQQTVTKAICMGFPMSAFVKNSLYYVPLALLMLLINHKEQSPILSISICGVLMAAYCYILNVYIIKNVEFIRISNNAKESVIIYMHKLKQMLTGGGVSPYVPYYCRREARLCITYNLVAR